MWRVKATIKAFLCDPCSSMDAIIRLPNGAMQGNELNHCNIYEAALSVRCLAVQGTQTLYGPSPLPCPAEKGKEKLREDKRNGKYIR